MPVSAAAPADSAPVDEAGLPPTPPRSWAMVVAFLRQYAARYAGTYLLGLGFLLATNLLTLAIPHLQKQIFDELGGPRRAGQVEHYALLIAAAAASVLVVRTLSRVLFFNPGRTIEFRIRNDMLARLLAMSPRFFRRSRLGDLMARATDDATYVRALAGFSVVMALNMVLAASLSLWRMLATDAWLTLACVLPLLGSVLALRHGVRRTFAMLHDSQKALGRLSDTVLETYKGIQVVQGAAAESAFLRKFDACNERYTQLNLRVVAVRTFVLPVVGVTGNLCVFLLLWVGGRHVVEGRMTLGDVAAYSAYVAVLVSALASAGWVVGVLQRGLVSLRRVFDVLELEPDLPQGTVPLPPSSRGLEVRVSHLRYMHDDHDNATTPSSPTDRALRAATERTAHVALEQAERAGGGDATGLASEPSGAAPLPAKRAGVIADTLTPPRPALDDVSFHLQPGQVLGIHGPVGSGKSTLVALLGRLLVPPRGSVFFDGVDLCDVAAGDLRRAVAIVPQEAFLFTRSVRDNIGFVDRPADIDEAKVWQAARRAALEPEIHRFEAGLDTVVGERGLTLSGGQRQRVQLARAFYRGFRLLVLDDVLSAVDHATETELLEAIRAEIRGRGTSAIIVSHRLSALALADEVLVLDAGQVVERGSHAELLRRGGLYARVWEAQRERRDEPGVEHLDIIAE